MRIRHKRSYAVEVCPVGHPEFEAGPGEIVDADDELGAQLLEQSDAWELAGAPAALTTEKGK